MPQSLEDIVDAIVAKYPEYAPDAYFFMTQALDASVKRFRKPDSDPHLSAEELYLGFCATALEEYGPMALLVLEHWGIESSKDVGELVYNLIEFGVFGRRSGDYREQFSSLPPLRKLLDEPFVPKKKYI